MPWTVGDVPDVKIYTERREVVDNGYETAVVIATKREGRSSSSSSSSEDKTRRTPCMNETELGGTSAAALAATVSEREEYVGRGTVERNAATAA